MGDSKHVEIGYLEKCDSWKVESRFFPSKVGGKPSWLDLRNIQADVNCGVCSKPCIFLCQVYAPLSDAEKSYHRTIFLFICKDPECCKTNKNDNFRVYRCQLPQKNEFYPIEEPVDEPNWRKDISIDKYTKTCAVCGAFGPHQCGKCKMIKYCSREHQVLDWKTGHNLNCGSDTTESKSDILFPVFEIMTEPEILGDEDVAQKNPEKSEEDKLKEYNELLSQGKATLQDVPSEVMEQLALANEDKYLKNYKKKLAICSDQVLRYERGGEPLWVAKPNINSEEIPSCEYCNGPRQFEFQVLSTMLNYLNVDSLNKSIDWGTLLIYTCKNSCDEGPAYKKEFLWKQDIL